MATPNPIVTEAERAQQRADATKGEIKPAASLNPRRAGREAGKREHGAPASSGGILPANRSDTEDRRKAIGDLEERSTKTQSP